MKWLLGLPFSVQSQAGGSLGDLAAASSCSVASLSVMVNWWFSSSDISNVAEVA